MSESETTKIILHHFKVPLVIRLVTLPFLAMAIYILFAAIDEVAGTRIVGAPRGSGSMPIGWAIVLIVVLIGGFIGIWFWQVWWLYDPSGNTFEQRWRGIFRTTHKMTPISEIKGVRIEYRRNLSRWWGRVCRATRRTNCGLDQSDDAAAGR